MAEHHCSIFNLHNILVLIGMFWHASWSDYLFYLAKEFIIKILSLFVVILSYFIVLKYFIIIAAMRSWLEIWEINGNQCSLHELPALQSQKVLLIIWLHVAPGFVPRCVFVYCLQHVLCLTYWHFAHIFKSCILASLTMLDF